MRKVKEQRKCRQCEHVFNVRRSWRLFCNSKCQQRWHYLKRLEVFKAGKRALAGLPVKARLDEL